MKLVADLHVHSRFSRATSRSLDFVALHRAALEKGIGLVGTGDFTHPAWMAEIEAQLEPAEQGLFRLKKELARQAAEGLPAACQGDVRFILQVEISNIYKREDRTRKNHNLVFAPSLEAAKKFSEKLDAIGNIKSDGRPILGLDARDLLEITLETDPLAFLIPAHIWTPWFSMLGSKSGFDSIEACFSDLADHIFAVETGLSSDPPMNWRLSQLDGIHLVSNSDAHSPAKLGREANLLDIDLSYESVHQALKTGRGLEGTIEFFPEEGKYHVDGHRKCGVRLDPEETRKLEGRCPECGGKLTVGVMSRVDDLADRPDGSRPATARPFASLVPLAEVAGEVLGVGPASKKVQALVRRMLAGLGPELPILRELPLEEVKRTAGEPVAEAIRRVRAGELSIDAGYDGEFGTVRIFSPSERDHLLGQMAFFGVEPPEKKAPRSRTPTEKPAPTKVDEPAPARPPELQLASPDDPLAGLDPDQRMAAETLEGPLLVVAGPGTGKTRTLVSRIGNLVRRGVARPDGVLAIAFTNQAALELEERISGLLPETGQGAPRIATFHGLGRSIIEALRGEPPDIVEEEQRLAAVEQAGRAAGQDLKVKDLAARISLVKQCPDPKAEIGDDPSFLSVFNHYEGILADAGLVDLDDLVLRAHRLLAANPEAARDLAARYASISVDEYQDVNHVQAALVKRLSPRGDNLMVIGDPNQAIYSFRGARPGHFARFGEAFPGTRSVALKTCYRLTRSVLDAARAVVDPVGTAQMSAIRSGMPVEIVGCPSPKSEAEQIVVRLERLIGGTSYFAIDSGRGDQADELEIGFGDVAVLSRTRAQRREILAALQQSGIPCQSVGEDEPHDPRSQKVAVMTMHASKGREFQVVFVTGVEPGLVPLDLEGFTSDPAEERRLLYVAVTRAKQLAVLSYASRRTLFGKSLPGGPSPLLDRMPESAVTRTRAALPSRKPPVDQLSLF